MSLKLKAISLFAALTLIVGGAFAPVYAGNRHNNSSDENQTENEWFEFDPENNGETFTWEGKPITIKLPENWDMNGDDWRSIWAKNNGDEEDNRGGEEADDEEWYDDENAEENGDSEYGDDEESDDPETEFDVDLSGEEEVPAVDSEGEGWANVRLLEDEKLVCVDMEVSSLDLPATDAHLHKAVEGQSGPAVLALPIPNEEGDAYGCVKADSTLLTAVMDNPEEYYVNVHSSEYPDGAARGQLSYSDSEEEEED